MNFSTYIIHNFFKTLINHQNHVDYSGVQLHDRNCGSTAILFQYTFDVEQIHGGIHFCHLDKRGVTDAFTCSYNTQVCLLEDVHKFLKLCINDYIIYKLVSYKAIYQPGPYAFHSPQCMRQSFPRPTSASSIPA